MRFLILPACHRHSRLKFKAWNDAYQERLSHSLRNLGQKGPKGGRALNAAFQSPPVQAASSKSNKGKGRRGSRFRMKSKQQRRSESSEGERAESSSGNVPSTGSGSGSGSGSEPEPAAIVRDYEKRWDARRRDSRVNGADIYVARFTKHGMGSARPCWRCLEWSRWAGIKRIFHWNDEEGKFDVVKVNSASLAHYETHADVRLFAGQVCNISCRRPHVANMV